MINYTFKKGKCDTCYIDTMSHFPIDINYIRNQVITKKNQSKVLCLEIQIGNQVTYLCFNHFKELYNKFRDQDVNK